MELQQFLHARQGWDDDAAVSRQAERANEFHGRQNAEGLHGVLRHQDRKVAVGGIAGGVKERNALVRHKESIT